MECKIRVSSGYTADQVLRKLGVPDEEEILYFVNMVKVSPNKKIKNGDQLTAMEIAGGG